MAEKSIINGTTVPRHTLVIICRSYFKLLYKHKGKRTKQVIYNYSEQFKIRIKNDHNSWHSHRDVTRTTKKKGYKILNQSEDTAL